MENQDQPGRHYHQKKPGNLTYLKDRQDEGNLILRIGLISDIHYADKADDNNNYYSRIPGRLERSISVFNDHNIDFMIILGDIIDGEDRETDLRNLGKMDDFLRKFHGERYCIPGNHDLDNLTKEEFLTYIGNEGRQSSHSFVRAGYRFMLLDGNYRQDGIGYCRGNFDWQDSFIPPGQVEWLRNDLELSGSAGQEVFVFIHQGLSDEHDPYGVKNSNDIRELFEQSGNVKAVFQGHKHVGENKCINGIHYLNIQAMIDAESNSFAELIIGSGSRIELKGYGCQPGMILG